MDDGGKPPDKPGRGRGRGRVLAQASSINESSSSSTGARRGPMPYQVPAPRSLPHGMKNDSPSNAASASRLYPSLPPEHDSKEQLSLKTVADIVVQNPPNNSEQEPMDAQDIIPQPITDQCKTESPKDDTPNGSPSSEPNEPIDSQAHGSIDTIPKFASNGTHVDSESPSRSATLDGTDDKNWTVVEHGKKSKQRIKDASNDGPIFGRDKKDPLQAAASASPQKTSDVKSPRADWQNGKSQLFEMDHAAGGDAPDQNDDFDDDEEDEGEHMEEWKREPGTRLCTFIVIPAPAFKINKTECVGIVFSHRKLGDWKVGHKLKKAVKLANGRCLYVGAFPIVEGDWVEYKYVVMDRKKPNIKRYEFLHHRFDNRNRKLEIPPRHVGDWFQIDGVCYPEHMGKSWGGAVLASMFNAIIRTSRQESGLSFAADYFEAWMWLIPKIEADGTFSYWFDLEKPPPPLVKNSPKTTPMKIHVVATVLNSLVRSYLNVFASTSPTKHFELDSLAQMVQTWLTHSIGKLCKSATPSLDDKRPSAALVISNCLYGMRELHIRESLVKEEHLLQLAEVLSSFGVDALMKTEWFGDREESSNQNLENPIPMLGNLCHTIGFHPAIIPILPIFQLPTLAQVDPKKTMAMDFLDIKWWLPGHLIGSKSIPLPAWRNEFALVEKYSSSVASNSEMFTYLLRLYARTPEHVLSLMDKFQSWEPERVVAWCAIYFQEWAGGDRGTLNWHQHLLALLTMATLALKSMESPNQYWIDPLPTILSILSSIFRSLGRSASLSDLMAVLRLASVVEEKLDAFENPNSEQYRQVLQWFLDSNATECLAPRKDWNEESASEVIMQSLALDLTGRVSRSLWLEQTKKLLKTWGKFPVCNQAIMGLCAKPEQQMDQTLRKRIEDEACAIAINVAMLKIGADCRASINIVKNMIGEHDAAYNLVFSSMILHCLRREFLESEAIDILKFLMDWSLAKICLDKNLIDRNKLNDDAKEHLNIVDRKILESFVDIRRGAITVSSALHIRSKLEQFSDVCRAYGDNSTEAIFDNLHAAINTHCHRLHALKTLKTYLQPPGKFGDYDQFFAMSSGIPPDDRAMVIPHICQLDEAGHFHPKLQILPELNLMAIRLEELGSNAFFNIFWSRTINSIDEPIPIEQCPQSIMPLAEHHALELLESLRTLTLPFAETDQFLTAMKSIPNKEEVVEDICKKFKIDDKWIRRSFEHISIFEHLRRCNRLSVELGTLINRLGLNECAADLERIKVVRNQDGRLSDVNEGMLSVFERIGKFTEEQTNFLLKLTRLGSFIEWLQEKFDDEADFQRFIMIARPAVSERERETLIVENGSRIVSECQKLIFGLDTAKIKLRELLNILESIWKHASDCAELAEKLQHISDEWQVLKELQDNRLDLEKSSIEEAKLINSEGIIQIGRVSANRESKATSMENWIRIAMPNGKTYTPTELRDLNSRLTLIGDQAEVATASKKEIEAFAKLYHESDRLATACQRHCQSGNVFLSDWNCKFYSNCTERETYAEAKFGSSAMVIPLTSGRPPILQEIQNLSRTLESALDQWDQFVERIRDECPILNHYTNSQLELLRRRLAATVGERRTLDSESRMLLMVINRSVDVRSVSDAIKNFLEIQQEQSAESDSAPSNMGAEDERMMFVRQLEELGIDRSEAILAAERFNYDLDKMDDILLWVGDHMDAMAETDDRRNTMSLRAAAVQGISYRDGQEVEIERMRDSDEMLASKVDQLWRTHMKKQEQSYEEFVSLRCLGHVLNYLDDLKRAEIATGDRQSDERPPVLPLKNTEPNLILANGDEEYRLVVTIHALLTGGRLPDIERVFVCHPWTTPEEIQLFTNRVDQSKDGDAYFSIVDVHRLNGEAARRLEVDVTSIISPFHLLIFGAKKDFETCPVANGVLRYQRVFENPESWLRSREFITGKMVVDSNGNWKGDWTSVGPENMANIFRVNLITSKGYGHGKSLCARRQHTSVSTGSPKTVRPDRALIKVPIHNTEVELETLYDLLFANSENNPSDQNRQKKNVDVQDHRFFHVDILNHQTAGVDTLLFQLFVLGGFTTPSGRVWRILDTDKYVVEISSTANDLLDANVDPTALPFRYLLPVVLCHSPTASLRNLNEEAGGGGRLINRYVSSRYCDFEWIFSPHVQRSSWYLSDSYTDEMFEMEHHARADERAVLETFMKTCGIKNPSWSDLESYAQFLSQQLTACEYSIFCDQAVVGDTLPGFRRFIVSFMKFMARDMATRSLLIAEDVSTLEQERFHDLAAYKTKHHWEQNGHPYVFFNNDGDSMSFFGCYFNGNGDLVDIKTGHTYASGARMASAALMIGLRQNGVDLTETFDGKKCAACRASRLAQLNCDGCRREKLKILCRVLGVSDEADPDKNYEITADNAMKILAIKMRLKCRIPVILMGETGCGKTRLVQFLCELESHGRRDFRNLILFKMHGGVTKRHMVDIVNEAMRLATDNWKRFEMPTYLFFDEANTTADVHFLKELICDGSMNGIKINAHENNLCIVAAVNPYRKHDEGMIKKFDSAGLGYHVKTDRVKRTFGTIPSRHLVYPVEPLSPSLIVFVIDFGMLSNEVENVYIRRMLDRFLDNMRRTIRNWQRDSASEAKTFELLTKVQAWMKDQKDETSFVSLRNIDRTLKTAEWFLTHSNLVLEWVKRGNPVQLPDLPRATLLALCVCYRSSLMQEKRDLFDRTVGRILGIPSDRQRGKFVQEELNRCHDIFLSNIKIGNNIAKNAALKENLFLMTLCVELKFPLFLIGRPGSSKSLAKSIMEENMRGPQSPGDIFKALKRATWYSFQCSPLATAEDIEEIFRKGAVYQKDKDLTKEVAVVVADEIGLADDTLALKSLHGLLEEGAKAADEPHFQPYHKVATIGLSNWALDPAKSNRGIFLTRPLPDEKELIETANIICRVDGSESPDQRVASLIEPLVRAYLKVYKTRHEDGVEFFGLRDFYSQQKMIHDIAIQVRLRKDVDGKAHSLDYADVMTAIRRNFSGKEDDQDTYIIFQNELRKFLNTKELQPVKPSQLIEQNLLGLPCRDRLNRYLLVLIDNDASLRTIREIEQLRNAEIIFGSGFPKDKEYVRVCKNINKIKVCMDRGKTVILLNLDSLYESLYDLLNQSFITSCGKHFVDLGLGTHRLKCSVHKDFRLVVVVERKKALTEFPVPLINRLEKHYLTLDSELDDEQRALLTRLQGWISDFISIDGEERIQVGNAFVGYTEDTLAALILDSVQKATISGRGWTCEDILQDVKIRLVQCATPESILRLPKTDLDHEEADDLQKLYFRDQGHSSFGEFLQKSEGTAIESLVHITTHSHLLGHSDLQHVCKIAGIDRDRVHSLKKNLNLYETEDEFLKDLNNIYETASSAKDVKTQYVLVQCPYLESDAALTSNCCFHLEKKFSDRPPDSRVQAILICGIPRKNGGSYVGFRTGPWRCVHIDQLIEMARDDSKSEMINLLSMQEKTVSTLLREYLQAWDSDGSQEGVSFNFDFLIADCIKLASAMIRDDSNRKLERVAILLNLWETDHDFARALCQRLIDLMSELERRKLTTDVWMLKEIDNLGFIFEHSTFAQSIRKLMEMDIKVLLAGLISVVDIGQNLNLIANEPEESWIRQLWLRIFEDRSLLDVRYNDSLYIEEDAGGFAREKEEYDVNSNVPPFNIPFYSLVTEKIEKILNVARTMEPAWGTLVVGDKVSQIHQYLKETAPWFEQLWPFVQDRDDEQHPFTNLYLSDVIRQNYPNANALLVPFLIRWLEHESSKAQYHPIIVGAQFANEHLARRIDWSIELANAAPSDLILKELGALSPAEMRPLESVGFETDVYLAGFICEFLVLKVNKAMDEQTLVANRVIELRANWSADASRVIPLLKLLLASNDSDMEMLKEIRQWYFSIELGQSYLEHVQGSSYLFKVTSIVEFAKRNFEKKGQASFWQHLESGLRFINPLMLAHFERIGATPDAHTSEALLMFFSDVVYEYFNTGIRRADPAASKQLLKYVAPSTNRSISFFVADGNDIRRAAFRTFILQTIACNDLDSAISHIDEQLPQFTDLSSEAYVSFVLLCVNSIEDSFHIRYASVAALGIDHASEHLVEYLDSIKRNGTIWTRLAERNSRLSGADLRTLAELRFLFSAVADLIYEKGADEAMEALNAWRALIVGVKNLCSGNQSIVVFFMKILCRSYGREMLTLCANRRGSLDWIVNNATLKNIQAPDPFMIYGESFTNTVASLSTLHTRRPNNQQQEVALQPANLNDGSILHVMLACFANVRMRLESWKNDDTERFFTECSRLIIQRQGQHAINLRMIPRLIADLPMETASLVWHAAAVVDHLPNVGHAEFFKSLLLNPRNSSDILFPTMDDDLKERFKLRTQRDDYGERFWACPNGHVYVIENCGRPVAGGICNQCQAQIGGVGYNRAAQGNALAPEYDAQVKFGHILGHAGSYTQTGQRGLSLTETLLIRCVLNATMVGSAYFHGNQNISDLINPRIADAQIVPYLMAHLNQDMDTLARSFDCNRDDVNLLLHQLLRYWAENQVLSGNELLELRTQEHRGVWEEKFAQNVLRHLVQNWKELVQQGRIAMTNANANPFWRQLLQDTSFTPDDPDRFWFYRPRSSFQSLMDQALNSLNSQPDDVKNRLNVLSLFLTDMPIFNVTRHLIAIRELHEMFTSHFHGCVSIRFAQATSIGTFLGTLHVDTAVQYRQLIEQFFEASLVTWTPRQRTLLMQQYANNPLALPLATILPLAPNTGSYGVELIRTLVNFQNDIVDAIAADAITQTPIDFGQLSRSQVINFDMNTDGPKLLMLHRTIDRDESVNGQIVGRFDLSLLQKRLQRFVLHSIAKISLPEKGIRLMKAREALMLESLKYLRSAEMKQLTPTQVQELINFARTNLPDTRTLADNLELMIRFSSAFKGNDSWNETLLSVFLKRLKPDADVKVIKGYTIAHLIPLWQLSIFMVKWLLTEKKIEDPFNELDAKYKIKLNAEEREQLESALAGKDVLQFVLELTEFLLLDTQHGGKADSQKENVFDEGLNTYIIDQPRCQLKDFALPPSILIKHSVDVWTLAARKYFRRNL